MNLKRIFNVLFGEGLYTFRYLVQSNLAEKKSDEHKYNEYLRLYDKLENIRYGNDNIKLSIINYDDILRDNGNNSGKLSEIISGLDCDYVAFAANGKIFKADFETAVNNAVYSLKKTDVKPDLLYYDYTIEGKPHFLPDYSPDYLRNCNYIRDNFIIAKDVLIKIADDYELDLTEYALPYEILLTACTIYVDESEIYHIQKVLADCKNGIYHIQKVLADCESCNEVSDAEITKSEKFIQKLLEKSNTNQAVKFEKSPSLNTSHILYVPKKLPKVSIIIPSKDNKKLIKECLDSVEKFTKFTPFEVVVVDNGSSEENQEAYKKIFENYKSFEIKYIYEKMEFNFSKMCNIGASNASGDYLLFLNDDIEVIAQPYDENMHTDWLGVLTGQAMQPHTGAVGAKLYFPDTKIIQHTGIINYESGAAHIHSREDESQIKTHHADVDCNYLAVTGACLMVSKEKFVKVCGFSETLAVTFNDVELCMKLYEAGFHNIVRKDVVLYHHESITRGEDAIDINKFRRHLEEREKLYDMHKSLVMRDPYYSPFLNQNRLDGSINCGNYVNLPASIKCAEKNQFVKADKQMSGKIYSVFLREGYIHIRGYAFVCGDKPKPAHKTYIYLKYKENEFVAGVHNLYEPTLGVYVNTKQNVNFASFYCCIDAFEIDSNFDISKCDIQIALSSDEKRFMLFS